MTEEQIIAKKNEELKHSASELSKLYAIRAKDCIDSFFNFFVEFWDIINQDNELELNWHIEYLCNQLQEIIERAIRKEEKKRDVIINIPPGLSKSTIVSQMLGAWTWIHAPHFVIITSTHSNELSIDQSIKSKDIFKSERYQIYFQSHIYSKFGKYLYLTKDNEKDWRNNFGGVRFFTSVGGAIIGKHAHLILWDDLIDVEKANSEAVRNKANRHVSKVLPTRKKDKAITPTIGIMQRLHEEDPTGSMLKLDKNIFNIKLPATTEGDINPPELREFYKDGLLDPNRLNRNILKEQRALLGEYDYAGQYDQEPAPKGGGKVKLSWWQYIDEHNLPPGLIWDLWIDGAYTKNEKNDPTGLMMCAYHKQRDRLYIRHAKGEFLEMPDLLKEVPKYCDMFGAGNRSRVYIEPKASGHSLKQMLGEVTKLSPVLIEGSLVGDGKEARLAVLSPRVESGKVILVNGSWTDKFTSQISSFPVAAHDENVDLLGYACDEYFGSTKAKGVKRTN
jgi:predicted phage terminase large subunit-like protein